MVQGVAEAVAGSKHNFLRKLEGVTDCRIDIEVGSGEVAEVIVTGVHDGQGAAGLEDSSSDGKRVGVAKHKIFGSGDGAGGAGSYSQGAASGGCREVGVDIEGAAAGGKIDGVARVDTGGVKVYSSATGDIQRVGGI